MKPQRFAAVMASLLCDGGLLAYSALASLGAPYFVRRKRRLQQKGRSDNEFDRARWTIDFGARADEVAAEPSTGPRVAIVAASWGELVTMEPLMRALRAARPSARLIFSVQHREAIAAANRLGDEAVLPLPFDHLWPVARWHARARPDLVVFYEQFEFPVLTRSLWARRVPFVVVHARVKVTRAYGRWAAHPAFKRWQLRGLSAMSLAASQQRDLIAPVAPARAQLRVVGSLKFPGARPQLTSQQQADLRAWIEAATGGAPLLVAGSTHPSEEAFVLDALEIMRAAREDRTAHLSRAPVLLIAPRRLQRADEVAQLLEVRGARVSRRSQWPSTAPAHPVDVLLLDTLGELSVVYQFASGTFVGGTVHGASHNVAEPLIWSVPVAYGPNRGNFGVEQNLCEQAGVGFRVRSPNELAAHWTTLLQSPQLQAQLSRRAEALVKAQRPAFENTLQILIEAVDAVTV